MAGNTLSFFQTASRQPQAVRCRKKDHYSFLSYKHFVLSYMIIAVLSISGKVIVRYYKMIIYYYRTISSPIG